MSVQGLLEHNIDVLRRHGITIEPVSEPWLRLFNVAGYGELTERQVLDLCYAVTTLAAPQILPSITRIGVNKTGQSG